MFLIEKIISDSNQSNQSKQSKQDKIAVLAQALNRSGPARITLAGPFMRNGKHVYDSLYSANAFEGLFVSEIAKPDIDSGYVEFVCVDGSKNPRAQPPGAESWLRLNMKLSIMGFLCEDRWRFGKVILRLGGKTSYEKINLFDRSMSLSFDAASGTLRVDFTKEWFVTDSPFFKNWSERLWTGGGWNGDGVRDEETVVQDIANEVDRLLRTSMSSKAGDVDRAIECMLDTGLGEDRFAALTYLVEALIDGAGAPQNLHVSSAGDSRIAKSIISLIPADADFQWIRRTFRV